MTRGPGRPITDHTPEAKADRARRADRRRKGICVECAKRKTGGKALCSACSRKSQANQRKLRVARRSEGKCAECGRWANHRARCPRCVTLRNARRTRQYAYRKSEYAATHHRERKAGRAWVKAGRCRLCGGPRAGKGSLCDRHQTMQRAQYARSAGVAKAARLARREALEVLVGEFTTARAAAIAIVGIGTRSLLSFADLGRIRFGLIGRERRFRLADVLAFKAERDAHPERQRTGRTKGLVVCG